MTTARVKLGRPGWPEEQVEFMRAHIHTKSAASIGAAIGRSHYAVYAKAAALDVPVRPGRKPNKRRREIALKFGITIRDLDRLLTTSFMDQLDTCKDDESRRILLGVSEQFTVAAPKVAVRIERVKTRPTPKPMRPIADIDRMIELAFGDERRRRTPLGMSPAVAERVRARAA